MNIPVLTISNRVPTESYYFYPQFLASCKRQGFSPIFIPCHPYRGLMSKPKYLLKFLESNPQMEGYESIIVCDAWDIIFLTSPEEIVYNAKAFGGKIVFNAERNCFPDYTLAEQFDVLAPDQVYRYLNSGFFVGSPALIKEILMAMNLQNIPDDFQGPDGKWVCENDQEHYQKYFLNHPQHAALDYRAVLCQSLHAAGDREFAYIPDRKRVVSLLTGNEPCVCHGNGGGKDWLRKMIGWLNL